MSRTPRRTHDGRLTVYITPEEILEAIGIDVLERLDAQDVALFWTSSDTCAVARFRLGTTGRYLGVAYHSLWADSRFVVPCDRVDAAEDPDHPSNFAINHNRCAYYRELGDIPGVLEQFLLANPATPASPRP